MDPGRATLSPSVPVTDQMTSRTVGPHDLADIVALLLASDLAVVGFKDFTDDEIATGLARDDVEHRGWYAGQGTLVGYAWVERIEDTEKVEVDVYVHPDHDADLGHVLVGWLVERGSRLAAEVGHPEVLLEVGVYRQDARTRAWLETAGFEVGTTFTRMRLDLDGPVDVPAVDGALVVRAGNDTEADRRVAHRIANQSFAEHYGHVDTSYETFLRRLTERGDGWTSVLLAELDGEPVGVLVATRDFEMDDNAGYVRTLGVLPAGRGRGVARAMLATYFEECQRAGRSAVLLHVDVANVTGALRLYESVGMRPVLEIDAFAKRSPV